LIACCCQTLGGEQSVCSGVLEHPAYAASNVLTLGANIPRYLPFDLRASAGH